MSSIWIVTADEWHEGTSIRSVCSSEENARGEANRVWAGITRFGGYYDEVNVIRYDLDGIAPEHPLAKTGEVVVTITRSEDE